MERREVSAPKAMAVQKGADRFARTFWAKYRVTCLDNISVPDFVDLLRGALP